MKKIITALLLTPIFFISHIAHADIKTDISNTETEIQKLKKEDEKIEIKDLTNLELSKKDIEKKVNNIHKRLTDKSKESEIKNKKINNLSKKLDKRKQELNSSFGLSKLLGDKPILDKLIDLVTLDDSVSHEMEKELNKAKEHNNKINEDVKYLTLDKKVNSKKLDKASNEIEKSKEENKTNSNKKEELKNKVKDLETKLENLKQESKKQESKKQESSEQESKNITTINYSHQPGGNIVLSNGNSAGSIGTNAAKEMERRTGVSSQTWEYIIARESNGDPNAYNPSGASGLFQTMPGWGSTNTVEEQINAAEKAYNYQGLSAWGV